MNNVTDFDQNIRHCFLQYQDGLKKYKLDVVIGDEC